MPNNRRKVIPERHSVAEFFAGIGLMREGMEKAGWKVVFANDIDAKKLEMYQNEFPNAHEHFKLGDIHTLSASNVPSVELATASFPCTDLSLAGYRHGLSGKQSSAFWGFIKIIKEMEHRKPPLILIENVPGFLTSRRGNDFQIAMEALNALGYAVDPFVVNASAFVPQSRARLFIVGVIGKGSPIAAAPLCKLRPKAVCDFVLSHPEIQWNIRDLPSLPEDRPSLSTVIENLPDEAEEWWSSKRVEYLLNQMSYEHRRIADEMISGERWSYGTVFRRMRHGKSMAELRTDGIAGCLRTPKGGSAKQILFRGGRGTASARLLTPRECARLMGSDDYKIEVPVDQALFGFGDAVCVPVVTWIANHYLTPLLEEWQTQGFVKEAIEA